MNSKDVRRLMKAVRNQLHKREAMMADIIGETYKPLSRKDREKWMVMVIDGLDEGEKREVINGAAVS